MPVALAEWVPHREDLPVRYCDCGTLLSTGNETTSCWACDPAWGRYNMLWSSDLGWALSELLNEG